MSPFILKTKHNDLRQCIPDTASDKRYWCHLHGASKALALAKLIAEKPQAYIVVCDNSQQANELESQLKFFEPSLPLLHFPDHETLPYDQFSPHQDIISERLACLHQLTHLKAFVLFVPVNTLMGRLPPRQFVQEQSFEVAVGDEINLDAFKRELEQANYQHVETQTFI